MEKQLQGRGALIWCAWCVLVGCGGPQSALAPAGRGAERISKIFWVMTTGTLIIWLLVVGLALYAIYFRQQPHSDRGVKRLIVGGGVVFPTIILTALLIYGLSTLPTFLAPAPKGSLTILVSGEQWWWRVRYFSPEGEPIDLANEIHLPVDEPVEFLLESRDVIHSFWIPSLGGKVDMIPGRQTRLLLEPTQTGVFRGTCAEYCGDSHALMGFSVVVHEKADFNRWLAKQAAPSSPPKEPLLLRGQGLFLANGCGACHTIRGTSAGGVIGPDLTHVGSRLSIGAGVLTSEPDNFLRWISQTKHLKPSVSMPTFDMLPPEELTAMGSYLEGLQ